jgi:hypothetical protein
MAIARVLQPGGVAGIIVSNRFMTTQAGRNVRTLLREQFDILHVWDMGDTELFKAAVLPAVLLLRKHAGLRNGHVAKFTSAYKRRDALTDVDARALLEAIRSPNEVPEEIASAVQIRTGTLEVDGDGGTWRLASKADAEWLEVVSRHTDRQFRDIGSIRVGVKTTADSIFIRSDWESAGPNGVPELLRPLTTHHIAARYRASGGNKLTQILYTHEVRDGRRTAVHIENYPKSLAYLSAFKAKLEARTYVAAAGRKWFEIWVPQDPAAWKKQKLVFRDIAEEPTFWMDLEGTVVNGDCYWLALDEGLSADLLWLALGVGNSRFIERYYDLRFNNKLYSGRRRFMTQYVELFPLPDPESSSAQAIVMLAKQLYGCFDSEMADALQRRLDSAVLASFGLEEEVSRQANLELAV